MDPWQMLVDCVCVCVCALACTISLHNYSLWLKRKKLRRTFVHSTIFINHLLNLGDKFQGVHTLCSRYLHWLNAFSSFHLRESSATEVQEVHE